MSSFVKRKNSYSSVVVSMVLLVSLVLTGCGQASVATQAPEVKKLRIGLVFDVGGRGDKSFNDSAYAGVEAARKELSDQLEVKVLNRSAAAKTGNNCSDCWLRINMI